MQYKIGVLGDRESVAGYRAAGLYAVACNTAAEAARALADMAAECAVLYITETLAQELQAEIAAYDDKKVPAIILIPGSGGSLGIGRQRLDAAVERAVGGNILQDGHGN